MAFGLSFFDVPITMNHATFVRYRYPSCNLRFDLINNDESVEDFKKRVNIKMRGDDTKDKGDGTSGSDPSVIGKVLAYLGCWVSLTLAIRN